MKKSTGLVTLLVVVALALSACSAVGQMIGSGVATVSAQVAQSNPSATVAPATPSTSSSAPLVEVQSPANTPAAAAQAVQAPNSFLAAYEGTLESLYSQVNPSVVSIHVISQTTVTNPFGRRSQGGTQTSEALGSGFVWDSQGHIVTNNHVISGATSIDVTFSDGRNYPAKLTAADPYSDLAVVQVDVPAGQLHPVTMGDSKLVKVGQLSIAIGNPYGLENSMTVGIISALGRSLPAGSDSTTTTGPSYTIPDIIQTDAPINPGNSGGVLLDDQGQVLGVTAAIASNSNSNAGIGFVIPSAIVKRVIPSLISTGAYQHPYLGISGLSLDASINSAMKLNAGQQGALVESITAGGPAEKAGLQAGSNQIDVNGQATVVGGDVIISVNGQAVKSMDDLIAYLESNVSVGQKITLGVLRNGKQISVDLTVGARPNQPLAQLFPVDLNPNSELIGTPVVGAVPEWQ